MSDLIVQLALGATLPQKHISSRPGLPKKRYSSFEVRQLVLFGAAAIVLLVFAWTFAYLAYHA